MTTFQPIEIRDVWADNFEEEAERIREIILKYPFVAMDTEFPGVVARPVGEYGPSDLIYQTLKINVDLLKIIQLGLTFTDNEGKYYDGVTCWQFNFKFSLNDDIFAQDSIELLKNSGINFDRFDKNGIDVHQFGEFMMMSGLVLNDDIKWISFHSSYDFGYLLKTLTCSSLPNDESMFLDLLHIYFPCIYDIKYMMTSVEGLYGGLNTLADLLQIERIGPVHQAGSDSLLTAQTFFALITKHFSGICDDSKFKGELFGLGTNHTKYKSKGYLGNNPNNGTSTNTVQVSISSSLQTQQQSMQYYSNIHYPNQSNGNAMTSISNGYGYNQDDFQDNGIY